MSAEDDGQQDEIPRNRIARIRRSKGRPCKSDAVKPAMAKAQGNVEIKQHSPAPLIREPAAQRQSDREGHQCKESPDRQSHRFQAIRIFVQQECLTQRKRETSRQAEKDASRYERR